MGQVGAPSNRTSVRRRLLAMLGQESCRCPSGLPGQPVQLMCTRRNRLSVQRTVAKLRVLRWLVTACEIRYMVSSGYLQVALERAREPVMLRHRQRHAVGELAQQVILGEGRGPAVNAASNWSMCVPVTVMPDVHSSSAVIASAGSGWGWPPSPRNRPWPSGLFSHTRRARPPVLR